MRQNRQKVEEEEAKTLNSGPPEWYCYLRHNCVTLLLPEFQLLFRIYIFCCVRVSLCSANRSFVSLWRTQTEKALSPVRNAIRKILPNPIIMYCYCSSIMGNNMLVLVEEAPTKFSLFWCQKGNSSGTNLLSGVEWRYLATRSLKIIWTESVSLIIIQRI